MKFQQLTGPALAKGLEDTVFYQYFLLTSLNEVGGEPNHFGISLEEFHACNLERQRWPYSMLRYFIHSPFKLEYHLIVLVQAPMTPKEAKT
jgi:(1->4)-alpha-D-glucan 1-alpha-D-glucosylmutase